MTTFERTQVELVPGWLVVGAMQGRTKPFDAFWANPSTPPQPCRDSFAIHTAEHDRAILFAVADGISSEPNSDHGARLAVETAIEELRVVDGGGLPDADGMKAAIGAAHRRLLAAAEKRGVPSQTMGTTLTVGALDRIDGVLVCASIGDGYVLARGVEDWWFPSSMVPEPTGAVHSITDPAWAKVCHVERCTFPVQTIVAVTDGLQRIVFEVDRSDPMSVVRRPYGRAITALQRAVLENTNVSKTRALSLFLGMRENEPLMLDDRTVVVLQRLSDGPLPVVSPLPSTTASVAAVSPVSKLMENSTSDVPLPQVSPTMVRERRLPRMLTALLFSAILIENAVLIARGIWSQWPEYLSANVSPPPEASAEKGAIKADPATAKVAVTAPCYEPNAVREPVAVGKHQLPTRLGDRIAEGACNPGSAPGASGTKAVETLRPPSPSSPMDAVDEAPFQRLRQTESRSDRLGLKLRGD